MAASVCGKCLEAQLLAVGFGRPPRGGISPGGKPAPAHGEKQSGTALRDLQTPSRVLAAPRRRSAHVCHVTSLEQGVSKAALQDECRQRLEGKVKIIGLGSRGSEIASKLESAVPGTQALCLDAEWTRDQAPAGEAVQQWLRQGGVSGRGQGNITAGDGGLAFVVTSANCVQGDPDSLLGVVRHLTEAGMFTTVALAQPFAFEGPKRAGAAEALLEKLQSTAHLVAAIDQNALLDAESMRGGEPVTVAEASHIADNALEHIVRCTLAAAQAPELLTGSRGALAWRGSELQHFRRLLAPPLQQFLAQSGRAAIGRGAAGISKGLQHSLGDCQALMQLASDAVRAAAESPFLEHVGRSACSALCYMALPAGGGDRSHNPEQRKLNQAAARLAVQAAAGTLREICQCEQLLMCYTTEPESEATVTAASLREREDGFQVEVSLLLLRHDYAEKRPQSNDNGSLPSRRAAPPPGGQPAARQKAPSKAPRLPASAWGALSAIAGGSADRPSPSEPSRPAPKPQPTPGGGSGINPGSRRQGSSRKNGVKDVLMVSASAQPVDPTKPSIGDQLADNLIAQSLDLPPKAAKWRKNQRAKSEQPQLMVQAPEAAWQPQDDQKEGLASTLRNLMGSPQQTFDIRERTFAILERDRGDAWEEMEE